MKTTLVAFSLVILYGIFYFISNWIRNIRLAKRSGLPYIISPFGPKSQFWQATHKIWMPIFRSLPFREFWEERIDVSAPNFAYRTRTKWFKKYGGAFLIVSPSWIVMQLSDPAAIHEVAKRRDDFPKWVETYGVLKQFGENIVTTEGAQWRLHRKATAGEFNERNTALVFREAIAQAQGMLDKWTNGTGYRKETLEKIHVDTMRVALHVISYVGFGLRLLWPQQSIPSDINPKIRKYASLDPAEGYQMSFSESVTILLDNILLLLLVPKWILRWLPSKRASDSLTAYRDYNKYTNALLDDKLIDIENGERSLEGMDLMGHLAQGAHDSTQKNAALSRDEILGNTFMMLLAGHETTGNILTFALMFLASNPSAQRQLQRDLDSIVGESKPETWNYEALVNPLTASMVGATMYETMRLIPGVPEIPKFVHKEQQLVVDGHQYMVPATTTVTLNAVAPQQDERYWPTRPSKITPGESDILDFVPDRWYQTMDNKGQLGTQGDDEAEDFGGYQGPDTNAQLFRPVRGSFIVFSEGARACLGRRIAQVEMVAVLTVLFQEYSLELAVDKWASDEQVSKMGKEELDSVYETAQAEAREVLNKAEVRTTLKLVGNDDVPLRLVKRGEERFVSWKD